MNKLAAGLIIFAFSRVLPVAAQTKPEDILTPRTRIYRPKYLKPDRADQVGRFVESVTPGIQIHWEPVLNGLVLTTGSQLSPGSPEGLDKAAELVKRFDVPEPAPPPERQIEMTVHLIRAYGEAGKGEGPIPPELAPVVKEMKGALPYNGFNLVDTIVVNVRDGLKLEDFLPDAVTNISGFAHFYSLEFHEPSVSADGKTVSVRGFRFAVRVPVNLNSSYVYQDVGIATPLTIYEGQKLVLGKIKLRESSPDDLFVVLSCKVK